jgi:hypothetical protein
MKIPTEICMKCTMDGMIFPSFTKHSIIGDSACSCHRVTDDTEMEDVESINGKVDGITGHLRATKKGSMVFVFRQADDTLI